MSEKVSEAICLFAERYVNAWMDRTGHSPESEILHGIASPCIVKTFVKTVQWLPRSFSAGTSLSKVELAVDLKLNADVHEFYTSQYAGDMNAEFKGNNVAILQVWSDDDFIRLQENLIGHLVTQRRLKRPPSLFIGTTDLDTDIIALCNLSGKIYLENIQTNHKIELSANLVSFINQLKPVVN